MWECRSQKLSLFRLCAHSTLVFSAEGDEHLLDARDILSRLRDLHRWAAKTFLIQCWCLTCQIFFAAVGAAGSIRIVMATAPSLFLFSSIQIGVHLALTLGVGKLLGFNQRDLLLASNANVGGRHQGS